MIHSRLGRALAPAAMLAGATLLMAGLVALEARRLAAQDAAAPAAAAPTYEKRWEEHPLPAPKSTCYTCHETQSLRVGRPARQHVSSAHARAGVTCVDCHGGDITKGKLEDAHNKDMGWIGKLDKDQMDERCGKCHQTEVMLFNKSSHIHDLEDVRKLDCSTCHGTHDIGARDVLFSWTATCAQCHTLDTIPPLPKELVAMMETKDTMQARLRKLRFQLENKAYPPEIMEHYREVRQKTADIVHNTRAKGIGPLMGDLSEKNKKLTDEINATIK